MNPVILSPVLATNLPLVSNPVRNAINIDYFTVNLKKSDAIYTAGEVVVGTLNLRTTQRIQVNCIKLIITGGAHVHWSEIDSQNANAENGSAYEPYLNTSLILVARRPNFDLYLEAGDYSYPFQFLIPASIPTSFEHPFGRIRYSLIGTLQVPWEFDKHTTRSFTVISPLDLNLNASLREPNTITTTKRFGSRGCRRSTITATLSVYKGGFVPGEDIVFNAMIDNRSSKGLNRLTVSLIQRIKFHGKNRSKECIRNVASVNLHKPVASKSVENWNNVLLKIPPVCSTTQGSSRLIEVSYLLAFTFGAVAPKLATDLVLPIVIGTIPIRQNFATDNFVPVPFSYEPSIFEPNPILMPSEFFHNGDVIESDNNFRPSYPYYNQQM